MSHIRIGLLVAALVSIVATTCKAMPDIHKHMSAQQLQSIFHVDNHAEVPHYELIKLLHHNQIEPASVTLTQNYRRRRRSIDTLPQPIPPSSSTSASQTHHVKKDLSKNQHSNKNNAPVNANSIDSDSASEKKDFRSIKEHKVSFNAFGENLNLTLKPTQGLFKNGELHKLPMWHMHEEQNATNGLNIQKIEDEHIHSSDHIGEVFQDEENMAAILMRRHEITGDLIMEGSIGHDMVIKPLPHDLNLSEDQAHHHVVYKRSVEPSDHLSDFAYMEPDDLATNAKLERIQSLRQKRSTLSQHRTTLDELEVEEEFAEAEHDDNREDAYSAHKRTKRQAPYIIYPEILVIVDYDGYRLHGGDNLQVKRYFISFWNGVDLRYRLLKGPRIRISIAGIIISRGRDATPYLERNRVGRDAIDSAAALTDMGKYLFRERRLPVYDIAVAITKYDMCRRRKGGRCTKGTAGFAYVGGACVVNKRLEKVNSVAIIEDTGGFSGIIVAAHEVGHLLGAVHDGSPPPSYLGGPGAQRCRWEDGYIMSDLRHTERGFRWSPCTVQSFHHFLNGDTATCLHNAPHEDSALGRSLPGTLLSLDAQCRRDRGTYACFKDERVCAQLFCFDAQTGYCVAYRPAAEGSACGNNLHCLDGRCTPLPSNVIPNYGPQYRLGYKSNKAIGDDIKENRKDDEEENITNEENDDEEEEEEKTIQEDDEENETTEEQEHDEDEVGVEEDEHENNENQEQEEEEREEEPIKTVNEKHVVNDLDIKVKIYDAIDEPLVHTGLLHNHIDRSHDNTVDETMLSHRDNANSIVSNNSKPNKQYNSTLDFQTYQYLAQLWQHFITTPKPKTSTTTKRTTTIATTTTTTTPPTLTTTTRKMSLIQQIALQRKIHGQQLQGQKQGIITDRTKVNRIGSSREMNTPYKQKKQQAPRQNIPTKIYPTKQLETEVDADNNNTNTNTTKQQPTPSPPPPPTTTNLFHSLRKQIQYFLKLFQDTTTQKQNNKTISNTPHQQQQQQNAIRKFNNSNNSTKNYSTSNRNGENTAHSNNNHAEQDVDSNNDDDDINDDEDETANEDNDESNETIEKQKRKSSNKTSSPSSFSTFTPPAVSRTTTAVGNQILQLQQASPPSAITTPAVYLTPVSRYGVKTSTSSVGTTTIRTMPTQTFFDTYLKKLQNLQNNNNNNKLSKPTTTKIIANTATPTSSSSSSPSSLREQHTDVTSSSSSSSPLTAITKSLNSDVETTKSATHEAQFLKRMQNLQINKQQQITATTSVFRNNQNINNHNNNNYPLSSNSSINSSSKRSNNSSATTTTNSNYKNNFNDIKTESTEPTPTLAYVTNYIGDNTNNRISAIVQHQQQTATTTTLQQNSQQTNQNQKFYLKHQSPRYKIHNKDNNDDDADVDNDDEHREDHFESLIIQQQSSTTTTTSTTSTTTTTRRPKIKTQKLIRRLRTQIK